MAERTFLQRYKLFRIAYARWFGLVFAGGATLITASNLAWPVHSGDLKQLALNIGAGACFAAIGLVIYSVFTVIERRYRASSTGGSHHAQPLSPGAPSALGSSLPATFTGQIKIVVQRAAYLCAAASVAAIAWLVGTGSLAATMISAMRLALGRVPSYEIASAQALRYPQTLLCLCYASVLLYLAYRPQWWGKLLCAGGVIWIGFGLSVGSISGWQPALTWILSAGAVMSGAAIALQIVDPRLGFGLGSAEP
jgi:hypothetical protein